MTDLIIPPQADRDAAADFSCQPHQEKLRSGEWDSDPVIQALAKHRLAASQPTQSDALREAVIEECAKALEDDAKKCDCFARNERECGCGAWCEWKSITSQRAIEIVRGLQGK